MTEPTALPVQRHPRQTLHHVWAPKLGRTLMFTRQEQLKLWVMLEAHPGVTRYCERPASGEPERPGPQADFWALRDGAPVWLRIADEPQASDGTADPPVLAISEGELLRHRQWITNWLSLLPYLSSGSALNLRPLQADILAFVGPQARLADIEHRFARDDPTLVRTAVIASLHEGALVSMDLQRAPWHLGIDLFPGPFGPRGRTHAPR